MSATQKQISYALSLARKAGMSVTWMNSGWKGIALMKDRSGKVEDYLASLNSSEISRVIDALKSRAR